MNKRLDNPGFTLIEMLVAMAIMALVVSMVYGSYAATSQSLDIYSSRLTCSQRGGLVLRLMARHIRCAYRPATEPNLAESSGGNLQRVQIETRPSTFHGNTEDPRGELLSFATTAGLGREPGSASGLSRVRYRYDARTRTLSIASQPYLNQLHKKDLTESWQPILRDVTSVNVEFHDGRKWLRNWNAKKKRELPRAVKIAFTAADENGRSYDFAATIPILSRITTTTDVAGHKVGSGPL